MQYDDCQAIPCGSKNRTLAWRAGIAARWPLYPWLTVHPDFRLHSQLCESETLRQSNVAGGKGAGLINPQDASARDPQR